MTRWLVYLLLSLIADVLAWLLAPVLPLFARPQNGWCDNRNRIAVEPRLPDWLVWCQTPDNSLFGDAGWRTKHCRDYWDSYLGMVRWLCRNRAYGFSWSVLAAPVVAPFVADVAGDLSIDDGAGICGALHIRYGCYWQRKRVRRIGSLIVMLNVGWLLDPYAKSPGLALDQPRALFIFSPRIKTARD